MALVRSALTKSPHYHAILSKYRDLRVSGHVELKKFHAEHIRPILPGFSYESFRQFMKSYEAESLAVANASPVPIDGVVAPSAMSLADLLANSDLNARKGIAKMIGIGLAALEEIERNPALLSAKDRALLLAAAMKAQDSRVAAVAKIKQDARDDLAFNRALSKNLYENGTQD